MDYAEKIKRIRLEALEYFVVCPLRSLNCRRKIISGNNF